MKRDREYYLNKAIAMTAAEPDVAIHTAENAWPILRPYGLKEQEHFVVMTLDGAHKVIGIHCVSKGLLNKCVVHPREVFRPAIKDNAAAIIICHNHPSGQLQPSEEDKNVTSRLTDAGELLGIAVLDHLIVARSAYFSFCEAGLSLGGK